jgi:staphylococcal nuclease domain-containing protein 1
MSIHAGKVKSVLSGDSLVMTSIHNPGAERIISLAFVTSPHIRKEGDEQWAFESRDYLRKLVVGKAVTFQVLYQIPNTKREYATVTLSDGRKLPEEAIKEGWVKLRDDAGRKEDTEKALQQLNELKLLEAQARSADKGIWRSEGGRIEVQHDLGNPQQFLDEWKGKTVDGLVERVLSGDRMLLRLIISPTKHVQVMALVGGIRAPATERVNPSNQQVQPAEEFGNEAKQFVEDRLLQRNVKIDVLGLSPQNQLIASIRHPKGSIAKFLLEAGLARCTDNHSTLLGSDMAPLRQAEKEAQSAKRGLFKEHVAKSAPGGNLEATVTKIFSADVIYVRNKTGVEKRINISSVRGPRQTDAAEAPFRDEAKEFLRKRLIGKHVRLSIDGSRPATGEYEAKEVATVTYNDKNIGLLLVQEGWCSVVRHKRDDPDRAPNYDELLAAQEKAKEEKKGMWSGKPSAAKTYVDASESVQKAKMQLASLQRQKKIPAIVDFVKSGSRFLILIPREGIKLNFVLGGIRAPKSARNPNEKSEPFGQEAHDLASRRCNQRDVEVDVHSIDKTGGFIGELFVNRESFAKILVEEGLATVHEYSAEQSGNATELFAAQDRAKAARKNIWADYDPSQDVVEDETPQADDANDTNGDTVPQKRAKDYRDVVVTNIDENGKLKVQLIGSGTSALETMMSAFSSFHLNPANSSGLQGPPKAGDLVAAKFSEDGGWYRARIRSNDRTAKEAEVVYIDYGNSEKRLWSNLRPLSQPQFSVQKLKAQAVDAALSLLQLPTNKQYLQDSIAYMTELTAGKELVANVDFTDKDGALYITLYDAKADPSLADSINAEIMAEGLAMVPRKLKGWEKGFGDVLKVLREKERIAREEERRGMWEYGDLTED